MDPRTPLISLAVATGLLTACNPAAPQARPDCSQLAALPSDTALRLVRAFPQVEVEGGVALTQRPDDDERWYLLAQGGVVHTFTEDGAPTPFVDVSDLLAEASEAGLLGIAFHPNFDQNGYVYLSYTTPGAGAFISRIARYESLDGGLTLDRSTELVILDVTQPYTNHNGGDLHFGADGMLYFGFGDGGSSKDPDGNGQNTDTLLGAFVRLDVDGAEPYAIPADNPFAAGGGAPEIFAWGFRNPWRFSFDRETGELWAGDVGQFEWEEVDRVRLGGNYGWNIREGAHCFEAETCPTEGLVEPVAEFANPDNASVVGGYVYRGNAIPSLRGTYLYTDFYLGTLWGVVEGSEPTVLGDMGGRLVGAFGEGNDGELYAVDFGGGGIYRLEANEVSSTQRMPMRLSETGCVDSEDPSKPAADMIRYDVNVPFWSDGAQKERWISLPDNAKISIEDDGDFTVPSGSVLAKTFRRGGTMLETRLLIHHDDGRWAGYSYAWDEDGQDATLLQDSELRDYGGEPWLFPSRTDCAACHTSAAGGSLGLEAGQLLGTEGLSALTEAGFIDELPSGTPLPAVDGDAPLQDRARAYLHANCAQCHRPGGRSNTSANFVFTAAAADMGVCQVPPAAGDLGVAGASILEPGDPALSLLSLRLHATGSERMPPVGSLVPDTEGIALVDEWISSLTACP